MNGAKWTPGPWYVVQSVLVHAPDYKRVATCNDMDRRPPEMQANARLIAAAPDMAELLQWIALFADMRSKDDSKVFARVNRGALRTIRDKAEAALARARGEPL